MEIKYRSEVSGIEDVKGIFEPGISPEEKARATGNLTFGVDNQISTQSQASGPIFGCRDTDTGYP